MKKRSGKKTAGVKARRRMRSRSRAPGAIHSSRSAVFLVGFMGAGKTSVGRILGQRLNWAFEDLDDRVEQRERRTVSQIFRESGEKEFRRAETRALRSVLREIANGAVRIVALGGGAFVQKNNATLLQESGVATVFLDAPVDELWRRCSSQAAQAGAVRPLLQNLDHFSCLYDGRRKIYTKATLTVQTGGRSLEDITSEIIRALALNAAEVRVAGGEVE